MTWLAYDEGLIENIAARLDLRDPNRDALSAVIRRIGVGGFREVVCDLATGVGKTYVMAALVDYLAAAGVRNVLIVTPGKTIQDKTIANFRPGSRKYVPGLDCLPHLVTAETYRSASLGEDLRDPQVLKLFVFNVQQMIAPSAGASRRMRNLDELIGTDLYGYLQAAEDLVVIADEHHVYRAQARRFSAAVRGLQPRALVGLTATPDPDDEDKVIYRYTLGHAIADGLVKVPVIVYRKDGHDDPRTQLADACHLLRVKAVSYAATSPPEGQERVRPVLFVVCQTVQEAEDAAAVLASPGMIGEAASVLVITSQSSDEALASLAAVEDPGSPVRAVVSVDKLKEGWDVKNIGVIVALRALASQTLTEQILGRGLRLPYGARTGEPLIDQVDIVAHDSYRRLLAQKDSLIQRVIPGRPRSAGSPAQSVPAGGQPGDEQFSVTEQAAQGTFRLITHVRQPDGGPPREATSLVIQDFEDAIGPGRRDYKPALLQRVPGAPQIRFPRRVRKVTPVQFSLSDINDAEARAAGAAFAGEIGVPLVRVALSVRRTPKGRMSVSREAQPSEQATQQLLPASEVQRDLQRRVFRLGLVPQTEPELNAVTRIVAAFLEAAGAGTGSEVSWSAERARQAAAGIEALVQRAYDARRLRPAYESQAVILPAEPQPMPPDVRDRYDQFERGQWYKGWTKSVLPAASFDAATTEFTLAQLMDSSPEIAWWLRLRKVDGAYIELDAGGRYFPDFIALDLYGTCWIIEGKSDDEAGNRDAQTKKAAAEDHVRYVSDDSRFGTWRYLFCTETAIRNSAGSWDALVTASGGRLGH
ncbi:MAG TPA: DEAD/DEAH box helicase family protein [Trebonia sp.]|nr:DEAD/DEAH box helicase family protein [Trebonia sp.]